ncbi:MAG: cytochrome P450 [Candidatus Lambdaproteobacteria bacterium]|nr:cytochrome P450 [Candidatus Lambdaproteobacteria bacterium]
MDAQPLDFSLSDPDVIRDPYPTFAALRARDPVHWSPALRAWVLTAYDDVRQVLNDPLYTADRMTPFVQASERHGRGKAAELGRLLRHWVVFHDPPDHMRLRRLLNRAFTPREMKKLEPRIARMVRLLLERIAPRGETDLIADFAYPLPALVIMHMLGVPEADLERVRVWSEELGTFIGHSVESDRYERAHTAITEMADYFRRMARARRAHPQDDIVSALVGAMDEQGTLSEDELACNALYLLFAGHETTTNLIGNGIYHLLRNPAQYRLLRERPELVPTAVEEFLRYESPAFSSLRVASQDLELRGARIAQGERLVAFHSAANRDPAVFTDPERLDVTRDPNPHLSFGVGPHFCLGAPLARLEGRLAFEALLQGLPNLQLLDEHPPWSAQLILRGVTRLSLRFDPTPPARRASG